MASIATGSPRIRIMVKSIAGVALGGIRGGAGGWATSRSSVHVWSKLPLRWNTPAICLKKIETRRKRGENCWCKLEETGRDGGGKQRDRWSVCVCVYGGGEGKGGGVNRQFNVIERLFSFPFFFFVNSPI